MRGLRVVAAGAVIVLLTQSVAWGSVTPTPVRTTQKPEFDGTGNAGYIAWTQVDRSSGFHVWVKPTGTPAFQVNRRGFAFAGQVDQAGSLLAYEYDPPKGGADVRLYDMQTKTRVPVPRNVNTSRAEFFPAIFGNEFSFVRAGRTSVTLYLVADRSTGSKIAVRTLDANTNIVFANSIHLYGNWIAYALCKVSGNYQPKRCNAFRYDISGANTEKIPNPNDLLYFAPSADLAGNVYFERSGAGCGRHARLMEWTGTGNPTVFYAFPRGHDMQGTSIFNDGAGTLDLFVDFVTCRTLEADIYKFAIP